MARTTMSDNDATFESYLEGGSKLSGIYSQHGTELPSESVDNAILAAARREVGSGPGNRRYHKWQLPASMAAGLVFAIGMVTVLNQRIIILDGEQAAPQAAATPVQPVPGKPSLTSQLAEADQAESMDARQQTLARAAAGADEQAVAAARQSMAPVSASTYAGHDNINVSKLSFAERFALLKPGLKPAQIAVLLGEPSKKDDSTWTYRRITSQPGKSVEYQVSFNAANELATWNVKEIQE